MANNVQISIPFALLVEAIQQLRLEDKDRLLMLLEDMVAQEEEARFDQDPEQRAMLDQARAEYQAGDYVTLDEYLAGREPEDQ